MELSVKATPIKKSFLTPGVIVLLVLVVNGLIFALLRFVFGLGAVTNLNNQYPWGIWIGIDVAAGVALAAGGFTTAALGHIFHKEDYHHILRPALLTAMLGYTFVALGVVIDLGRYYNIWHVLIYWNGNSVLFEVGICVMAYLTVLYIEFLPVVTERMMGHVRLKGSFARFNKMIERLVNLLHRNLNRAMFFFVILGVVLSCLHQSSLGTLMMLAGSKIHPLWQSPIAPLMFLLSAIAVGFPMVIMESMVASRSFGLKPEIDVLSKLGRFVGPLLGVYLAFKVGDMVIRETFVYLLDFNLQSIMFMIEIVVGVIIPLRMFLSSSVLKTPSWLFTASLLTIFGVLLNRFNNFIIAYKPLYATEAYYPSIGEISVTVGFIAFEILLYRAFVMIFPVIGQPHKTYSPETKYAIRGTVR
ncbi:MAG: Ni/Fe-hydrogenase cytochrome b subunit [Calditrichaeota bacterium]|nr:Ni/Fe-hydrogenase cytochrome b subunit [Calditrichota bacterium]MCB0292663.1 Ni/Fe-hydrogenase cytochrome b subunit [Calditrichota bacterium]MCB0296813.1 Ni/Fe-hydrogenase cytochrome b subunit [Calditrichota bacterium]MCB0302970.1 Ni/Fe-hydrogenase cytochrome b subunit [Calditrichota bacterium]MCB9090654.1 Ni/Fe-hydrogenase cytochrome b subunit [Calditrichia bacterium]